MGQSTIKDALARKKQQSPQYDYMWRVELPDLAKPGFMERTDTGGAQMPQSDGSMLDSSLSYLKDMLMGSQSGPGGAMDELNHRVSSFDSPFFQMDTKKITNQNSFWYAASNNDIGGITMTIDEFEDGKTFEYLNKWKGLIINDDGTYNPPYEYKKDIKFIRMSATNLDLHVFYYRGYFITEVSNIQNTYDSNDIIQYSVIFTGDSMEHIPISPSEVKSRVQSEETSIMLKDWANDKFRVDGMAGADKVRLLGDLSRVFT